MNNLIGNTITSMEVAQMVGKEHKELLRDVRRYCEQFNESSLALVEFFKESAYIDGKGESRPCFMVTKKGCEFIAHKLTGRKGTEFTARYINRFHEMEAQIGESALTDNPGKVANLINVLAKRMDKQGSEPYKSAEMAKMICMQYGIQLPADFVKIPEYKQMSLSDIITGEE